MGDLAVCSISADNRVCTASSKHSKPKSQSTVARRSLVGEVVHHRVACRVALKVHQLRIGSGGMFWSIPQTQSDGLVPSNFFLAESSLASRNGLTT